ncbi:hypothetical protein [Rhizobium sp. BK251]|uniref:hypothetical protein n=1 Tax=Rhizobium sp. BK251 TaxID=2512125 RepID=UPI0010ECF8BF|nr:hypothetical protein [Rhizobium sp. BK251]TCL63213.1 hypothetical protein EV286_11727 [Rhizobium sp. BK251]
MQGLNSEYDHAYIRPDQGPKLAKEGDLFPREANKWTHRDASVTYAKNDRFRERPQKVRFLTSATLDTLLGFGLPRSLDSDEETQEAARGITHGRQDVASEEQVTY